MGDTRDNCGTCMYYKGGICRRYPPTMNAALTPAAPSLKAWWPQVQESDWCGEHTPAAAE